MNGWNWAVYEPLANAGITELAESITGILLLTVHFCWLLKIFFAILPVLATVGCFQNYIHKLSACKPVAKGNSRNRDFFKYAMTHKHGDHFKNYCGKIAKAAATLSDSISYCRTDGIFATCPSICFAL